MLSPRIHRIADAPPGEEPAPRYSVCTLVTDPAQYEPLQASFRAGGFDGASTEYLFIDNGQGQEACAYAGGNALLAAARGRFGYGDLACLHERDGLGCDAPTAPGGRYSGARRHRDRAACRPVGDADAEVETRAQGFVRLAGRPENERLGNFAERMRDELRSRGAAFHEGAHGKNGTRGRRDVLRCVDRTAASSTAPDVGRDRAVLGARSTGSRRAARS
jgi:hypothetical protein